MSAAFLNVVIGLVTSIIGGAYVWGWQRVRNASSLRRREKFFGLEPRGTCLIVMNNRVGQTLAARLPGVTVDTTASREIPAIVAGGQEFRRCRGEQDYALVAKFTPPGSARPVFLISGQTALSNRGAVHFLKRGYPSLFKSLESVDRFCIVVRVAATGTYGYQAADLAADLSATAFRPARLGAPS